MRISYRKRPELKCITDYSKKIISKNVFDKVNEIQLSLYEIGINYLKENTFKGCFLFHKNTTYVYDFNSTYFEYQIYRNGILQEEYNSKRENLTNHSKSQILMIIAFNTFVKYAKIETKILSSKSKDNIFNCKYLNETNEDITIIDSTWFTNLVKSENFKVRGHFRLQPKKIDGEWTKELIWINEFKKNGYTSSARKLHIN